MNAEDAMGGGSNKLIKTEIAIALASLLEKMFSTTVIGPALSQIGLVLGDQIKFFRIRNLVRLNEHLEDVLKERKLDPSNLQQISLSVGFPLLEKASYQDDDVLQKQWANLLASSITKHEDEDNGFGLEITYIEILHQFSRLDCEVLEYIAENGVAQRNPDGTMALQPLDPLEIRKALPNKMAHIALEKLVSLGCAYRVTSTPLSPKGGDGYSALAQDIVPTLIGLNLYMVASGNQPRWMPG